VLVKFVGRCRCVQNVCVLEDGDSEVEKMREFDLL
jgi:hypothetical protein